MYTKHFGFKILPFENVPDPAFFFDQGDHARIRKRVEDSLRVGRGLIVVTGPIGSGKTTLSQMIKSDLSSSTKLIWMAVPPENSTDLFLFIAQELGLHPSTSEKVFVIRDIKDALLKINSEGKKCLLIIDESHLMQDDVINGLRLLNNLEEGSTKLMQILLLGQDELMDVINRPEMEPFKQRIATLEIIGKMDVDRVRRYVSYRVEVAGGDPSIFIETGWEALALAFNSEGTPRRINTLCDRALSLACEREKNMVDVYDVYDAAQGMGLGKAIFHYIVAIKNRERNRQSATNTEETSAKDQEKPVKEPVRPFVRKMDETVKIINPATYRSAQNASERSSFMARIIRKAMARPVVSILLLAAFIVGFLLYWLFLTD